jgi:EAL domain-containing protein (putative c-di-GMP-specific phosphodiesterase class I)
VRWEHPEHGLLLPAEFLSQAEETGLIFEIDRFVLKEASRQVREWQERHPLDPPLVLGVNLSTKQFSQPNMVEEISQTLKETGLDPRTLKLEITEGFAIENVNATEVILRELKGQGIRVAIDDFGTGYSSLFYLKQLPIDCLKIDRSFVEGLGHDPEAKALVRTTIELARALGLRVTGEGIETAEQLAHLRELGCNRGQGYYFAHPLTSDAASTLFAEAPADSLRSRRPIDKQHRAGSEKS